MTEQTYDVREELAEVNVAELDLREDLSYCPYF